MALLGICQALRTPKILEIAGDMGGVSVKGFWGCFEKLPSDSGLAWGMMECGSWWHYNG